MAAAHARYSVAAVTSPDAWGRRMEFAERQLRERGWSWGKGLGQREDGISEPIKVKVKCDTAGIGHHMGEQFTFHWWDHVFNKAAASIVVQPVEDGVEVQRAKAEVQEQVPITNKKPRKAGLCQDLLYGRFVKAATLMPGRQEEAAEGSRGSESSGSDEDEKLDLSSSSRLTDEELVRVCGGRTAHRGARHGLTMNAKLARLEEQEQEFLAKYGQRPRAGSCPETQAGAKPRKEEEKKERKVKKRQVSPGRGAGAEGRPQCEEAVGPGAEGVGELLPKRRAKRHKRRRGDEETGAELL